MISDFIRMTLVWRWIYSKCPLSFYLFGDCICVDYGRYAFRNRLTLSIHCTSFCRIIVYHSYYLFAHGMSARIYCNVVQGIM